MAKISKKLKKIRRHRKVRAKVKGTATRPRISVFRSNKHIYTQLIDDENQKTLLSFSDTALKLKKANAGKVLAYEVGKQLATKAVAKGLKKAVFDRGGYKFHGQIKELARGAKEGGLVF